MVVQRETLIDWNLRWAGQVGGGANSMTPERAGISIYGV